ncbi:MAG: DNA replication and repair protein RecF [Bdellovibrionales bacterium]|nr:DNA replication and repair protein RecF [Bdellovibrionales bacterium]
MYFKNIQLHAYRNYSSMKLNLHPKVNIFLGKNGQGKTNLLEAIYFCTKGQSFRPGHGLTYIQKNDLLVKPTSVIHSQIFAHKLEFDVKVMIEEHKKQYYVNQRKENSTFLARKFPSVLFSPESLAVIKEGPEARRHLIDEFLMGISENTARALRDYKRCLKTRNKVLRDYKHELKTLVETERLLESLDQLFLPLSASVSFARINALRSLLPGLKSSMSYISCRENVDISVDYVISSLSSLHLEYDQILQILTRRRDELRSAELSSGTTLVGPHKHDIHFLFEGEDSRFYCSQGQQRAIILSFKMAQIMYHREVLEDEPVLLLDDVLSELDGEKRASLVKFLKEIPSQIIVTTTDLSFPNDFDRAMSVFDIRNGTAIERITGNEVCFV